ncbi:MAG: M48 family metallopeptidase [Candidatus Berkelbacteria bacterium]|nr:M48 family metallopeptidase [Candidatus Berkelbacteria bacterium]
MSDISYILIRRRRRTLSVEIRNKKVIVRAPLFLGRRYIESFLRGKRAWIESKLRQPQPKVQDKKFVEGEEFKVLGKAYRLKLLLGSPKETKISGNNIVVKAADLNPRYIRKLIENFYISVLKQKIDEILAKYKGEFNLGGRKLIVKFYRSKWGSCSAKDCLSFNAKLAQAPEEVIGYVAVHELAHLQEKNHSRRFWELVSKFCPDYKSYRKYLNQNRPLFKF